MYICITKYDYPTVLRGVQKTRENECKYWAPLNTAKLVKILSGITKQNV